MVKRHLLAGLIFGIVGFSGSGFAAESDFTMKDNTISSGFSIKEETTGSTIARFRGDGNVGIGVTEPSALLHIKTTLHEKLRFQLGDTSSGQRTHINFYNNSNSSILSRITAYDSGDIAIAAGAGANDQVVIQSGGNVGIGTTAPGAKLHVDDRLGIETIRVGGTLVNNSGWIQFQHSGGRGGILGVTTPGNIFDGAITGSLALRGEAGVHVAVGSSASNGITVTTAGNVGIGTTSPADLLHLKNSGGSLAVNVDAGSVALGDVKFSENGVRKWAIRKETSGDLSLFVDQSNAGKAFAIQGDSGTNLITVKTASGNVGIGTTAPTQRLDVAGNINASGSVTQGSSREFKKNISYISTDMAMEAFMALNPVMFEYKADKTGEKHLGFIAEDVPDLVATHDRKHLNAMDLTAVLTKVVQEQQKMLDKAMETISALKAEIEEIKGKI